MTLALSQSPRSFAPASGPVSTLIYRSREVRHFEPRHLARLVSAAQTRNRRENVTGCVVYDRGRFLQWLEGPSRGVGRIAASIRRDARHTDIQVLSEKADETRTFADWNMRLALGDRSADWAALGDIESADSDLIDILHTGHGDVAAGLRRISERHRAAARPAPAAFLTEERLASLVRSALTPDSGRVRGEIEVLIGDHPSPARASLVLAMAVANRLRSAWNADDCSASDVQIALATIGHAIQMVTLHNPRRGDGSKGHVIVAADPRETHYLAVSLTEELLAEAGFAVRSVFPGNWDDFGAELKKGRETGAVLIGSLVFDRAHLRGQTDQVLSRLAAAAGRPVGFFTLGRRAAPHSPAGRNTIHCTPSTLLDRMQARTALN